MDVLSDVLRVVRLSGGVFFTADFSAPWALDSPNPELLSAVVQTGAECMIPLHILIEGECLVESEANPPVKMSAGDAIMFPHGDPHTLRSHRSAKPAPIRAVFSRGSRDELRHVSFGGGGRKSRVLCGYLSCEQRFDPLISALPNVLRVRASDGHRVIEAIGDGGRRHAVVLPDPGTRLGTALKSTMNEVRSARPGKVAILGGLTELMFVEILRGYMEQLSSSHRGWLAGLKDPHVGTALKLLHANPEENWTVGRLAREAAASRSAFAQRFTRIVGEGPMHYLARWRMQIARQMLRDGSHSVQEIAARVGYESEAAFSRAFKRAAGSPPAVWRRGVMAVLAGSWSALVTGLPGFAAELRAGLEAFVC